MAKKSEIIGEFIVTIHDNGSVEVSRIYKVTKDALKEIWTTNRKEMPEKDWTTQEWGRQVLKEFCGGAKEGVIGEYSVEREENNRINVIRTYKNTMDGLRKVAETLEFHPEPKQQGWNTQRYGAVLVKFAQTGEMPKLKEENISETNQKEMNKIENKMGKNMKTVTLRLNGDGMRLDIFDENGDVCECQNPGFYDGTIYSIRVIDENGETEVDADEIEESVYPYDDEEKKYEWLDACYYGNENLTDIESIHGIQTKVEGEVKIEIPTDETFDIKKASWMCDEIALPEEEVSYTIGVIYDGKSFPINLDIESEREVDDEELWCR